MLTYVYVKVSQITSPTSSMALMAAAALVLSLGAVSCSPDRGTPADAGSASTAAASEAGSAGDTQEDASIDAAPLAVEEPEPPEPIPPEHLVLAFRDGTARELDDRRAAEKGLTIVNLRDDWAPQVLRGTDELPSAYEKTYIGLANEEGEPVDHADPRTADYYLEVYGISPSFSVIRERFEQESAKACFTDYDQEALRSFEGFRAYRPHKRARLRKRAAAFHTLERRVKQALRSQGVDRIDELEGEETLVAMWERRAPRGLALRAAQKRLTCERLFPGRRGTHHMSDAFDWATHIALLNFERRHRFYGWGYLNQETAEALSWFPPATAYHTIKRALTERVIDAAEIIEDGSTFRDGKAPTYTGADGEPQKVRNLVAEFSEAALEHLGLTGPEAAVDFLEDHDFSTLRVALPLPEVPEYYSDHMDLEAVIDRGDVWYDFPYDDEGNEIVQPVGRRPTLTLYTRYRSQKIPLIRYGTTIGGWRSTMRDGVEYWAYKNSDVGPRVWRKVIGGPSWIPPGSTPLRDLVTKHRSSGGRRYEVNYPEFGPGYASAYGLVMGVHERPVERDGETIYMDNGIRSHGSVNYQSIQKRHSHGCHRLHNHLALRLFGFVLDHRHHKRLGREEVNYRRRITYEDQTFTIEIDTRGYRFDLEPPLPITVTRGRVLGERQTPIEEYTIKPSERARLEREAAEAAQGDAGPAAGGDAGPAAGGDAGPATTNQEATTPSSDTTNEPATSDNAN